MWAEACAAAEGPDNLAEGRHLLFQEYPSAMAIALASCGSSTILPTAPVKSMATRDRTDSCNKDNVTLIIVVLIRQHWQIKNYIEFEVH